MRPLSDACHKALLPIGDTTILARIVDSLLGIEVGFITVVTGYRADEVEEYLTQRYGPDLFQFVRNDKFAETNNIVSLSMALEQIRRDEDVVLIECDLLFDPRLLTTLAPPGQGNVALVDRYRTGMDGTVVSVVNGMVSQVFPPNVQGGDFVFDDKFKTLNVYRFGGHWCEQTLRPLVSVYASQVDANCYYEIVLGMLAGLPEHRIAVEIVDGDLWTEVDDPNDLSVARFHFEPERRVELMDRSFGGNWNLRVTDFSLMHNVHFPTPAMIAAMRHALPDVISSYGSTQQVLNEKLAWFTGSRADRLQVLHGASQAFPMLRKALSGLSIAIPTPTFGEFPRAFPDSVRYCDAPGVELRDLDNLASQVEVLVVVNPNNPTGTVIATPQLHELIDRHRSTRFLVDESFIEFRGEGSLVTMLEESGLENTIVLVSLSKTLGVPGLRLGYAYSCDPTFIAELGESLPIWNLSSMAEFFLEILLKFRPELDESIARTMADREEFRRILALVPGVAEVYRGGGNFVLARLDGPAELGARVRDALLTSAAIDVKDVSSRFPDGGARLRMAVRHVDENIGFCDALTRCLAPESR
jgi:histidinol-phosphate/aromatic aminotransferase/cobyric acid decarboxylase-like protein/choline kinase